ncbi:hypothetical protein CEN41_06985 [Fischerella thermalis CCMEE 5330]|uniref:Uncharacterized protein n=1 Tax=Fischerella thermalis CCMEE 5330 TaxID=2019670 RepID=A0A2N6MGX9_9CYAN|nr:hypothetical protein CEN41_06985 [Fischerella thermalis CCMEE 5330]
MVSSWLSPHHPYPTGSRALRVYTPSPYFPTSSPPNSPLTSYHTPHTPPLREAAMRLYTPHTPHTPILPLVHEYPPGYCQDVKTILQCNQFVVGALCYFNVLTHL